MSIPADPSEATLVTLLGNAVLVFDQLLNQMINSSDGYPILENHVLTTILSSTPELGQAAINSRAQLANFFSVSNRRAWLDPIIIGLGIAKGYPETDVLSILDLWYKEWASAGKTMKTRNYTYGTPTGPIGTGTGTAYRYTVDSYGYNIELPWTETKTLTCISDATNGAQAHEELFQFKGTNAGADILDLRGSGAIANFRAYSARDSLISNPSFSIVEGTTPTVTGLTNWTLDSGTLPLVDGTNYFRGFVGDTTPYAAKFAADAVLSQLLSVRGSAFDPRTPYNLIVAYNRSTGSGTGTLQITLGGKTKSVTLGSALSGWQRVTLTMTGSDLWFNNWNTTAPAVKIGISGSSGYTLIDDVLLVPGVNVDGTYLWICGGATKFLRNDYWTYSDSDSNVNGKINRMLSRTYSRYMPGSQTPTFSDPT